MNVIELSRLKDLPYFAGLTTVELEEIASIVAAREYKAGDRIMREGDSIGHPIYFLLKGTVDVVKTGLGGRDHVITTLSAPSVFGEIELLGRRAAIASVVASGAVSVAELSRGAYEEMVEASRTAMLKVVKNLAQTLARRLAATDQQLAAHFDKHEAASNASLGRVHGVLFSG